MDAIPFPQNLNADQNKMDCASEIDLFSDDKRVCK